MKLTMIPFFAALILGSAISLGAAGPKPAPPSPTAPAAQQKIQEASDTLSKARVALQNVEAPLLKAFQATQEWIDASKAQQLAQTKFDAAKSALATKIQAMPEYAVAMEAKRKAQEAKDAIVKDDTATIDQRMAAAQAVMDQGKIVTTLETSAETADPGYQETWKNLIAAQAVLDKLNKSFADSIKDKPEWQAAKKAVDDAQAALDQANKDLATAQQADVVANAQYQQQLAQYNKQALQSGAKYTPKR